MREKRSKKVIKSSPEALYIFGGVETSPVYSQPGGGYLTAYDRGSAAVDYMPADVWVAGNFSGNLATRDAHVEGINRTVLNAEEIERSRYRIACVLNSIYPPRLR